MRKAKRWRYYCDFCNKCGGSAFHMRNHESACTNNPDRRCNMCKLLDLTQVPMKRLKGIIAAYESRVYSFVYPPYDRDSSDQAAKELMDALKKETDGCPACIFAAIRQTETWHVGFQWEKERDVYMSRVKSYKEAKMPCGGY